MLFSLRWLTEFCPVDASAAGVADALTDRGLTVDSVTPCGDDQTFDVDIPANRPDCLGHLGLARELAAALTPGAHAELFEVPFPLPTVAAPETGGDGVDSSVALEVDDPALCPRYSATVVRDVTIGPSPSWVVSRLQACGLRSINNVVDASNLVLLGLGHPIHCFDLATLEPRPGAERPAIVVRTPRDDERTMTTLDGEARSLEPDTLLIADGRRPIALAGVMGGCETEIGPETRTVLIEAAAFCADSIRRTSRRLALQTDASFRFARGVDPSGIPAAQAMAIDLLARLAGGRPGPGMLDLAAAASPSARVELRAAEVERLLGYRPDDRTLHEALAALGLAPVAGAAGTLRISVPSYRYDLGREADVVEEVARHLGYDRIPTRAPVSTGAGRPPARETEERARDLFAASGFHEAFAYAMIADGEDLPFVDAEAPDALPLDNPIAETMGVLRRSVLPGLVRAAALNQRRGARDVRLFEIGHVFLARTDRPLPDEPRRLGLAWSGAGEPRHWSREPRSVDLYDTIGLVERTVASLGPGLVLRRAEPRAPAAFHPGRSLGWTDAGTGRLVARAGELHPALAAELDFPLYVAELELDPLAVASAAVAQHTGVSRLPTASRDLSLVLPRDLRYEQILETLNRPSAPAPVEFAVIDRYIGPPLPPDRVSLTIRLTLTPRERTLVDDETDGYRLELIEALRRDLGVEIRG